jgi:hypothetical protein
MSRRNHGFLITMTHAPRRPKVQKPEQIAEICQSCKGACKSVPGLKICPGRAKYERAVRWD